MARAKALTKTQPASAVQGFALAGFSPNRAVVKRDSTTIFFNLTCRTTFSSPTIQTPPWRNGNVSMKTDDPRKHYPGIFPTYKTLRSGERRTSWYHRATGTRLPGEPGSPEFAKAFLAATGNKPKDAGTVAGLIRAFTTSPRFDKRWASTQKEYRRMLKAADSRASTPATARRSSGLRQTLRNS